MTDGRSSARSSRVYRALLRLYPERFRRQFQRQMQEMFADSYADCARVGRRAIAALWVKTLRDLARNVPAAHLRRSVWKDAPKARRQHNSSESGRLIMESFFADVRYALRTLIKNPLFTSAAVITLGFGIGANSAIFSVVHGVLLRPLPYPDQEDMVVMLTQFPDQNNMQFPVSPAEFLDYRAETEALSELAAYSINNATVTGDGTAEQVQLSGATRNLFNLLGARPIVGRTFTEEEDSPGGPRVAVLSHTFWTTRFGADRNVVGQTLTASGRTYEIVGVLPAEFSPPGSSPAFYTTLQFDRASIVDRSGHWLTVVGRLAPGRTLESASTEIAGVARRWEEAYADQHTTNTTNHPMYLMSLEDRIFGQIRPTMWILLAAVGMVLLLACANVANLLLAKAETRVREMGVRSALGAPRGRLVRQLLTESVVLSLLGGGAGLLLAVAGTKLLLALEPGNVPRLGSVAVDWQVIGFTAAIAALTGIAFGLAPAWNTSRVDVASHLSRGGRSGMLGRDSRRTLRALVVAQVALAIVLLVGSGLLIKSFLILQRVDPGFESANRIGFRVSLPSASYPSLDDIVRFYQGLFDRIDAMPGVQSVAAARGAPMRSGIGFERMRIEGRHVTDDQEEPGVEYQSVTPGYFATMGIPVVRGREFAATDRGDAPAVALINETAARAHFPGADPIGQRILPMFGRDSGWRTIVGVVGDVRHDGLASDPKPQLYLTHAQTPANWAVGVVRSSDVVIRAQVTPEALAPAIRAAVRQLDPDVPVINLANLEDAVTGSVAAQRFVMTLLAAFAAIALVISAVGVYAVISFSVARRTQEIGVRLALGAEPSRVLASVLRDGATLAAIGGAVGLTAAFLGTRLMESLVFGIGVRDVTVFGLATATLLLVAFAASFIPARRASATDPITSLRSE